jgi:hypothetical protein
MGVTSLTIRKIVLFGLLLYGVLSHFQQYFSYIVAVSFIGGGNQSTRGKQQTEYISP